MRGSGKKLGVFLLFLAAVWLCVIWWHSMAPATASAEESDSVLILCNQFLAAIHIPFVLTSFLVRKCAHFTEYAILALLLTNGLRRVCRGIWLPLSLWLGLVAPMIDETIQLFVEGRSGAVSDVWLDYGGFLAELVLAAVLRKMVRTKKS